MTNRANKERQSIEAAKAVFHTAATNLSLERQLGIKLLQIKDLYSVLN
jgi:hypothetical protein